MKQHRILFVCLGNICRSPLAEGAMRRLIAEEDRLDDFLLASAGTSGVHAGEPADARAVAVARAQRLDISGHRARAVTAEDFKSFDLILAMDASNREALRAMAPEGLERKVHLLLEFSSWIGEANVPDPYYGGPEGFEEVLDLIELALRGLMVSLDHFTREAAVPEMPRARLKVSSAM